jgi:hypothetical protein
MEKLRKEFNKNITYVTAYVISDVIRGGGKFTL